LLRALGTLGDDQSVQQRAGELYAAPASIDPSLLPAVIAVSAYTGDTDRYEEFVRRFKTAGTPQEERRFLYALAAFRSPDLINRTLEKSINGEVRTQDGPFLIGASLSSVYGREQAWEFVKSNWETMERLFPKTGLRRMCGGIVGLATRRLERDVRKFFHERKIDFGGKILEQYLEQLHVVVTLRERETESLRRYLRKFPASRTVDRPSRRTKGATI
jgi:puromycin-sensitive aminopeptidase